MHMTTWNGTAARLTSLSCRSSVALPLPLTITLLLGLPLPTGDAIG